VNTVEHIALWRLHVDFLHRVSIQESSSDVDRVTFEVVGSNEGEESTYNGQADCRGKGLNKVPTRSLGKALGNQTDFVPLNGAICSALDVEYPARSNRSMASRELHKAPGAIVHVCSNLLLACHLLFCFLWACHGLFKGFYPVLDDPVIVMNSL
jgi:hypothetical protein